MFDPLPANLEITVSAKPMWVDQPSLALFDYNSALRNQEKSSDRQNETDSFQSFGITNQKSFQLKAIGFVIQKDYTITSAYAL